MNGAVALIKFEPSPKNHCTLAIVSKVFVYIDVSWNTTSKGSHQSIGLMV